MKKLLIIVIFLFFGFSASSETIAYKLNAKLKIEGSTSIEVNATPLVDNKTIEKSKDRLASIIIYAENQSKKVSTINKNRGESDDFCYGKQIGTRLVQLSLNGFVSICSTTRRSKDHISR